MNIICFFHADCFDGLAAAWAVWKKFPDATFYGLDYRDEFPCLITKEDHVVIVDFSFPLERMRLLRDLAHRITFIDHHPGSKVIADELYKEEPRWSVNWYEFNAEFSGAVLAWRHFHRVKVPQLLRHISDRDRWVFELADTKAIISGLGCYPKVFEVWKTLPIDDPKFNQQLLDKGAPLRQQYESLRDSIIRQTKRTITLSGHTVPLINCPRDIASEALELLYQGYPFSVGYYDDSTHRIFNLRSCKKTGIDVSAIARQYGGGGHLNAAGFTVSRDHPLAQY